MKSLLLAAALFWAAPAFAQSVYFTVQNGPTLPTIKFNYSTAYACQDWQGGAAYLGLRSYLGPLPPQNQPQPDPTMWSAGTRMPITRGKDGVRGGTCAYSPVPAPDGQSWSFVRYPTIGGVLKITTGGDENQCNALLVASRRHKHPHDPTVKFSSRCMAEGTNTN